MKQQKYKNKDVYIGIGVAIAILLLIVILVAIPNSKYQAKPERPTNTTKQDSSGNSSTKPPDSDAPQESNSPSQQEEAHTSPEPTEPEPTQNQTPPNTPEPTKPTTPSCYHEEQGVCWDELEDNNYSAGLYDHEYGHYGASVIYPDPCDAFCRDIVEDAYDEGWYDASY